MLANSGSEKDASDIFQEALIDIYQQAKYKNLTLTCPFEPFFLLVCKRKWITQLRKNTLLPVTKDQADFLQDGENVFEQADQLKKQAEESEVFMRLLSKMGLSCQDIIRNSLSGQRQEKIAELLGVTYGYLRKKKSECMASLIELIKKYKEKEPL